MYLTLHFFFQFSGVNAMVHITCQNATIEEVENALKEAKKRGISNILARFGEKRAGR